VRHRVPSHFSWTLPVRLRDVTAQTFALQLRKANKNLSCGSRIAVSAWRLATGSLIGPAEVCSPSFKGDGHAVIAF
jgi:hypothetical protein